MNGKLWFDFPQDKVDQWKAGATNALQMMQREPSWAGHPFPEMSSSTVVAV
jgi:hypothetical protein